MDLHLKDKVIIVTGGAKGIGEGIVKVLAAEGAIPVIIGRNEKDNLDTVAAIEAAGGKCAQVPAELMQPAACENAVKSVIAKFGRIDGVVNNAGANDGGGTGRMATTKPLWHRCIKIWCITILLFTMLCPN